MDRFNLTEPGSEITFSFSNVTQAPKFFVSEEAWSKAMTVVYIILFFVSTPLTIAVAASVLKRSERLLRLNWLILSLCLAVIIYLISEILVILAEFLVSIGFTSEVIGRVRIAFIGSGMVGFLSSTITKLEIAWTRYVAVKRASQANREKIGDRIWITLIVLPWFVSVAVGIAISCTGLDKYFFYAGHDYIDMAMAILQVVRVVAMTVLYVLICYYIKALHDASPAPEAIQRSRMMTVKGIIIYLIIFILLVLPENIFQIVYGLKYPDDPGSLLGAFVLKIVGVVGDFGSVDMSPLFLLLICSRIRKAMKNSARNYICGSLKAT